MSKLPPLATDDVEAERRKQQIDQIRDYFAQIGRLHSVAFRLRVANSDDCKSWAWAQIGLDAGTAASLPRKYRSFVHEALAVSWNQATVLSVAETSPAAAAGIKPGDHLLTFNNVPVTPVKACAIPIELATDPTLNAFTTDDGIVVYSSLLRLARTDAQLALIIGHELAHANLGHLGKQRVNTIIGWAGGAALDAGIMLGGISTGGAFSKQLARAGAQAFSVAFEREADYVGAYYAARAGYDLTRAEDIWRAFALETPDSIRISGDHPVTPVRFVQMQKAAAEIADKQRRHEPLIPELKAIQLEAETASNSAESMR